MSTVTDPLQYFAKEIQEFSHILQKSGVHAALQYLNKRTPHRFTGLYKYDGDTLRNLAIHDEFEPAIQQGEDAPMEATYCSLLQKKQELEIQDAAEDSRVKGKVITPVVSYCGVLIRDADGTPFGSLCHFDMNRCQERISDFPLLKSVAHILYNHLYA